MSKLNTIIALVFVSVLTLAACKDIPPERPEPSNQPSTDPEPDPDPGSDIANIDLNNWKVTLPIPRPDGNPLEVEPPEILDYANNEILNEFMYNDSSDGSLVFYTYPGVSTTNSSYSRTELREQMVPGSNSTNWTFEEGGRMKGTLSVPEISNYQNGEPHRTMIMQIHGRLTDQQKNLIGASDNNAPPVLKIYWRDDKIYVRTKELLDLDATYEESLHTSAWGDDDGQYFTRVVGTDTFTLEVIASDGMMSVTLDDDETFTYDGIHMEKWGVFENYFKAGNYLQTTSEGSFARVKYYDLEVTHE